MSSRAPAASPTRLPRVVWLLGWVSFFTDTASEAIYPLLPLYLTGVLGARPLALGVIEGVAEATASVLKLASGYVSDRFRRRRAIVIAGYTVSSLVRPLVAVAGAWWHVLAVRFADRIGKGIRGAPRDAVLAGATGPELRGRVFGLQRAMDHAGAVAGPLLATLFLLWRPGDYRTLFLLTFVPGLVVIALVRRMPSDGREGLAAVTGSPAPPITWRAVPVRVLAVLGVLFLFTLGNSTDAYLLLHLSNAGVPAAALPLLWSALHFVKASSSLVGGRLADRFGRRALISGGWVIYAAVYLGFAASTSAGVLVALFVVYGLSFGLTEAPEKALLADLSPSAVRGSVFGLYGLATGVGAFAASVVCGVLWEWRGPPVAFGAGALLAASAAVLIWPAARQPAGER